MQCLYCEDSVHPERVAIGYQWCTKETCVSMGLSRSNRIVLVCGHKSGYQPMFVNEVASQAAHPKRT